MSMFNEYQEAYMRELSEIPPEQKCYCGWYRLGKCQNNCPPDKTNADKIAERSGGTKGGREEQHGKRG